MIRENKKILYTISIIIFVVLSLVFLLPTYNTKIIAAAVLITCGVILNYFIKKTEIKSINSNQVLLLMIVIGLVYVMLYYLTGLHFGFHKASLPISLLSITSVIIPVVIVVCTSEFIVDRLLSQRDPFVEVLVFLSLLFVELSMFSNIGNINTFNQFMDVIGLTLIPAVTRTFLFVYISKLYGPGPNIAFRLITGLFLYIIPFAPSTPDSLVALGKLIIPILIYSFIEMLYKNSHEITNEAEFRIRYYIMPIPAPAPAGIAGAGSLIIATTDSVVRSVDTTLVAF
jgi:hypothetical protein